MDLDGTIRTTKSGEKFITKPDDQKPLEKASHITQVYHNNGWNIIGITNQKGVDFGYKTLEDCMKEQVVTMSLFPQLWTILFCPDEGETMIRVCPNGKTETIQNQGSFDSFRKPGIGMIQWYREQFASLPTQELLVGDMESDLQCAEKAGIDFLWAKDWRSAATIDS